MFDDWRIEFMGCIPQLQWKHNDDLTGFGGCHIFRQTHSDWCFGTCFIFPYESWECHHPDWRTHIFQRGRYATNQRWMCPCSVVISLGSFLNGRWSKNIRTWGRSLKTLPFTYDFQTLRVKFVCQISVCQTFYKGGFNIFNGNFNYKWFPLPCRPRRFYVHIVLS